MKKKKPGWVSANQKAKLKKRGDKRPDIEKKKGKMGKER